MNRGRLCERLFPMSFRHPCCNPTEKNLFQNKFSILLCLSYENFKCLHRNHSPKCENCFAIFISVCNFHITHFGIVPTKTFAIFIWVCNFRISLQFSCHDSSTSYVCGFTWIPCHCELELINSTSATELRGRDKEKLELSKFDYYLLLKSS
jgi:hypothetical protein